MDNKKKQFKGFRFSIFWMYAIIGMVLMGLFTSTTPLQKNR